jgi:hypothetical protein
MRKLIHKKFYAFIVTAMMFSANANAQIVYTDVNPDVTINTNGGVYALDLNNDGITDFNITYNTTTVFSTRTNVLIGITPLGVNKVGNDTTYPGALLLNSNIDSNSFTWKNNSNQNLLTRTWFVYGFPFPLYRIRYSGNWNGESNKYIPLQLDVNSQKYYGWVRLDVPLGAVSFTVKDYAYNSSPNQSILAGQTIATGIVENSFASTIKLFPNPADNHLTIDLGSNIKKVVRKDSYGEVIISDITGKIVYSTTTNDPDSPDSYRDRENKIEVNTSEFAVGIYFVQIQSAGFIGTKKLVVEK